MNKIHTIDDKDIIRNLSMDLVANAVTREELSAIEAFIRNKDKKKEYNKDLFGPRIGSSIIKNYGIFELVANMNRRGEMYRYYYCSVRKIDGLKIKLMEKKTNDYTSLIITLREPMYILKGTFDNYSMGFFEDMAAKKIKDRVYSFISEKVDLSLFFSKAMPEFEAVYDDNFNTILRNNTKYTGMVIKDAASIGRPGIFGGILEYCDFFENNEKNTDLIIKFVKKNGLFPNISKYQLSKSNIIKNILPEMKRKRGRFGMPPIFGIKENGDLVLKLLENQKSVDFDVLQEVLNHNFLHDKTMAKIKNSKKIRNKFKDNPTAMLLLMLQ
jgi:hypothetical protein